MVKMRFNQGNRTFISRDSTNLDRRKKRENTWMAVHFPTAFSCNDCTVLSLKSDCLLTVHERVYIHMRWKASKREGCKIFGIFTSLSISWYDLNHPSCRNQTQSTCQLPNTNTTKHKDGWADDTRSTGACPSCFHTGGNSTIRICSGKWESLKQVLHCSVPQGFRLKWFELFGWGAKATAISKRATVNMLVVVNSQSSPDLHDCIIVLIGRHTIIIKQQRNTLIDYRDFWGRSEHVSLLQQFVYLLYAI